MKIRNLILSTGLFVFVSLAAIQFSLAATISAKGFVHNASIANKFEIDSSKLALEKSQSADVKTFAQQMIDDHTKAGSQLEATLQSSKEKIKAEARLDKKHQSLLNKLNAATSGEVFDRQYIALQTNAHKEAVKLFTNYAKKGKDSALKDFAAQTLSTLKDHLAHVQQLKAGNGA
jgi:putative membrane protein